LAITNFRSAARHWWLWIGLGTAVMRAILDTGFKGYVAQEFIPKREPMKSLQEAARICDV